jgi:hypothetical protein
MGAEIFMIAEYKQGWTYLESLYFAYTSLLTIGYGGQYHIYCTHNASWAYKLRRLLSKIE